ncbi:unnamed protein product [Hymenolepis diminuta]|uniref:SH2 domain-containing protein n=1 Tax=Hymenolepis diminuta TaxID=6216 RepID=A0A0R3STI5_HYMDI|nr:unnamed protein product [Hymenolepis diminuta]VUZ41203.1 unnamed protein product [Hymenolepis diminuta]
MQAIGTPEPAHNARSLVNVYRRASKLFARMTHSSRSRTRQQDSNSKSIVEVVRGTTKKHHCKHRHQNVCPVHGRVKSKVGSTDTEPSNREKVFYPVLIDPPRKRSSSKPSLHRYSSLSAPADNQSDYLTSNDLTSSLKHSSPLRSGKLHMPIIKSSSTSTAESLSSFRIRDSLVLAFNKKLEKRNHSKILSDSSQYYSSDVQTECSRSSVVSNATPSTNIHEDVGVFLIEKSSDGTYIIQFKRESPIHKFGVFFNSDDNGYYISKQTRELQCQNASFILHSHDRVLSIQGVPSKLLTPHGIKELLQGSHVMNIKIAPLRCN